MTPEFDSARRRRQVLIVCGVPLSLGWLLPAAVAWWASSTAARQVANGTRIHNSFPYEAYAADFGSLAWWWALSAAAAWLLGGAAYLRWRRTAR